MELKKQYKWSLIVPTSMGVRITPINNQAVHTGNTFIMQVTSAETNVATIPAYLGLPVKALTAFVKDNPIAKLIKDNLLSRHIDYEGVEIEQGGPWGYRHQFNITDSGYGVRGPRVFNDRAGEVGRVLSLSHFDIQKLFSEEGVQIVHISGLIAALSKETAIFCVELAKAAKKQGTIISFDLNYRASFWKEREKELTNTFSEIASLSDIIIGNEEDFQLCLHIEGPKAGGEDISNQINKYKEMIMKVKQTFPQASVFASTLRDVVDANTHQWGAILLEKEHWHIVEPRKIYVLDRIGGGDGFVGGMLYAILKEWEPEKWIQFGWASGALATTSLTDYALPVDEEQLWEIWRGNARVKR